MFHSLVRPPVPTTWVWRPGRAKANVRCPRSTANRRPHRSGHLERGAATWPITVTKWVRSSGGTLTSELVGLGDSDANNRWIGIRRHQAVLSVVGVGLLSEWLFSSSAPASEVIVALAILTSAAPTYDGLTVGEQLVVALRYFVRSHWSVISALEFGDDIALWANRDVAFRGYELIHRGRLDLSGRDL